MPLINIYMLKGKPRPYIRAITDGVHQALVEAYGAPSNDRFQFVHQFDKEDFEYDPDYLNVHRTDDLVMINIVAGNWRDTGAKKALYKSIVEHLSNSPGVRPEDIIVYLNSNDRDEWSFGNGMASYVKG